MVLVLKKFHNKRTTCSNFFEKKSELETPTGISEASKNGQFSSENHKRTGSQKGRLSKKLSSDQGSIPKTGLYTQNDDRRVS